MLTLQSLIGATKQQSAYGEGQHNFGKGTAKIIPVPRDKAARPKSQKK